ncbi:hypothetical protein NUG23_21725, partial [Streptomyces sp. PAL114]|nr:hypothetical protein [Streptomyces sp. PAL114]
SSPSLAGADGGCRSSCATSWNAGRHTWSTKRTAARRPHPGVESGAKNMALGPVAALMDRTKDTVRKAMGGS